MNERVRSEFWCCRACVRTPLMLVLWRILSQARRPGRGVQVWLDVYLVQGMSAAAVCAMLLRVGLASTHVRFSTQLSFSCYHTQSFTCSAATGIACSVQVLMLSTSGAVLWRWLSDSWMVMKEIDDTGADPERRHRRILQRQAYCL